MPQFDLKYLLVQDYPNYVFMDQTCTWTKYPTKHPLGFGNSQNMLLNQSSYTEKNCWKKCWYSLCCCRLGHTEEPWKPWTHILHLLQRSWIHSSCKCGLISGCGTFWTRGFALPLWLKLLYFICTHLNINWGKHWE